MPQLFVLSGPDVGKSFEVTHNDTLGRSPDCIVTLRDASISRRHAHIERVGAAWFVVDDGSRNGITVDGARTKRAELHDAQEFTLGELLLRFRTGSAEPATAAPKPAPAPPPEPDEIVLEGGAEEIELEDEPAPRAAAAPPPAPVRAPPPEIVATSFAPRAEAPPRSGAVLDTGFGRRGAGDAISRRKPGAGDRVLQYHKVENARGAAGTDLAQLPAWLRWSAYLLVLAVAALLAYLAFFGASSLKSRLGLGTGGEAARDAEQ